MFLIRTARPEDAAQIVAIDAQCFNLTEAARPETVAKKMANYNGHYWVIIDTDREDKVVTYLNGYCTDKKDLLDEDMDHPETAHNEKGVWQMFCGLATLPEYQGKGLAGMIMDHAIHLAKEDGRKGVVLTCKDHLVPFYEKRFGYVNEGRSTSSHCGATWNQMRLTFYQFSDTDSYEVISQTGVSQYVYPLRYSHNAIWDSNAGPDGKLYFGLSTEIATAGYVRLCCYDPKTGEVEECFRAEDVILPDDRAIRASKFHSSISFMPDGRILMTTHTTDKSPCHPTWMPHAYYNHVWEGFAGGNILIYDPVKKKAENLGIPVVHESIYGSIYEPAHNAVWCLGFLKGHLYRFDLSTRKVRDFGKVSETYSFRLSLGPDGNLYSASKTGHLYKIDTEKQEIIDLNYQFKYEPFEYHTIYNNLAIARTGPDGRLYLSGMYSKNLIAYDTTTGTFEDMGPFLPTARYSALENRNCVFGMDFDSEGVLWYVVTSLNNYEANLEFGIPASLYRWDVTRGKHPEWLGVAGTPERACGWNSEVVITKDDMLYITGSNHSLDGPDITAVDLKKFRRDMYHRGGKLKDRYFDPKAEEYIASAEEIHAQETIMAENSVFTELPTAFSPVLLWRALAPDHIEDSAVKCLSWEKDGTLTGICGGNEFYEFSIREGKLVRLEKTDRRPEKKSTAKKSLPQGSDAFPCYPGRQYQAAAYAAADLTGGRKLVATRDGMLSIAGDKGVYALGPGAINGPVHDMASTPDGTAVYGVAGYEEDLGVIFCFDDVKGLRWLGCAGAASGPTVDDTFFCTYITSCAVSLDGKYLAVGAEERLGTVVIYQIAD